MLIYVFIWGDGDRNGLAGHIVGEQWSLTVKFFLREGLQFYNPTGSARESKLFHKQTNIWDNQFVLLVAILMGL